MRIRTDMSITQFNEQELELLISGTPDIDVDVDVNRFFRN